MDQRADDIVIQTETPGAATTMFRVAVGRKVIAEHLTDAEAHELVGNIIERLRSQLRWRLSLSKLNEATTYLRSRRRA
jgi:hypothetical protein